MHESEETQQSSAEASYAQRPQLRQQSPHLSPLLVFALIPGVLVCHGGMGKEMGYGKDLGFLQNSLGGWSPDSLFPAAAVPRDSRAPTSPHPEI